MHLIDHATAAPGNLFTEGNPLNGTAATVLTAKWANTVQAELAGIVGAAGIALSDQNNAQLLAALRAAGVFQTPAQFDDSTRVATTAFANRIGLSSSYAQAAASKTLDAATHAGKVTDCITASQTHFLPDSVTTRYGAMYLLRCSAGAGNSVTISRSGTDQISNGLTGITTFNIKTGDTALVINSGSGFWSLVGGSSHLVTSPLFAGSIGISGYQKLPSGLIVQWGEYTAAAADTQYLVSLPITYPYAHYWAMAGIKWGGLYSGSAAAYALAYSSTQIALTADYSAGQSTNIPMSWLSIGA